MEKIKCEVIRDMLPLYVDDIVSDGTREIVEEHLKDCEECRKEEMVMRSGISIPVNMDVRIEEANILKRMKKAVKNKRIKTAVASIVMTCVVIAGLCAVFTIRWKIPYDSTQMRIESYNGVKTLVVTDEAASQCLTTGGVLPSIEDEAGNKKNVAFICMYESLWSKYVEPLWAESGKYAFPIDDDQISVDEIYYGEYDAEKIQKTTDCLEDAELIWKNE